MLSLSVSCQSVAQESKPLLPWYIGMGLGDNTYELTKLDNINTSDGPYAWELFVGIPVGQYLAVEIGYRELGNNEFNLIPGNKLSISFLGNLPLKTDWSLFSEIGLIHDLSFFGASGSKSPYLGIGLNYQLDSAIKLQGVFRRYELLDIEDNYEKNIASNYWGMRITYLFH